MSISRGKAWESRQLLAKDTSLSPDGEKPGSNGRGCALSVPLRVKKRNAQRKGLWREINAYDCGLLEKTRGRDLNAKVTGHLDHVGLGEKVWGTETRNYDPNRSMPWPIRRTQSRHQRKQSLRGVSRTISFRMRRLTRYLRISDRGRNRIGEALKRLFGISFL